MHRFRLAAAALLCAALTSACYRITVTTGTAPTATVVDVPWAHSFIVGLVPPSPVDVAQKCAGGNVSKVVTQHSFVNGLVAAVTWNIYTPMQVTVTCGSGPVRTSSLGLPPEMLGTTAAAAAPAQQ
jgi:hypothetical protein